MQYMFVKKFNFIGFVLLCLEQYQSHIQSAESFCHDLLLGI